MRCHPGSYRLSFLLPAGATACSGSHQPSPDGCSLEISFPLAVITGPSREATFEQAARLLRIACRGQRLSISALLETPAKPIGSDPWSIILGADVAFSPTSLDPHFPKSEEASCPAPAASEKSVSVMQTAD